jgi:hypothetical protein
MRNSRWVRLLAYVTLLRNEYLHLFYESSTATLFQMR